MYRVGYSALLFLFLYAMPAQAGVAVIESAPEAEFADLDSLERARELRIKNLGAPPAPTSCDPNSAGPHKQNLESLKGHLEMQSQLITRIKEFAPKSEDRNSYIKLKEEAERESKALSDQAEAEQLCVFRQELAAYTRSAIKDTTNKALAEDLQAVSECLARDPAGALAVRNTFKDFFLGIFNHFFNKPELTDEDCKLLESTYSVWASSFEAENEASAKADANKIPAYNVNNHNASFYYWAEEQRKGRVPSTGLTIFHADTHTDMGHVHTHYSSHWAGNAFDLKQTQNLLMERNIKEAISASLKASKRIPEESKASILELVREMPEDKLRAELEENMRKTVHHIAQPLAAAQYAGSSNGKFVMCMPPWSKELPRSAPVKREGGETSMQPLVAEFARNNGSAGFEFECSKAPPGPWNLTCQSGGKKREVLGTSEFQVLDCNQEERTQIGTASSGEPIYSYKQKSGGFPYKSFFTEQDKKDGFLLDIDLDVFVSEGNGKLVMPISFERTKRHQKSFGPHSGHGMNSESDVYVQVSTKELGLIHQRMDKFFADLAEARRDGYLPKVVTIADSSALLRAVMPRKQGEDSNSTGVQAYTPECLVFLVNYMTRKRLKEIYPEISFQ